MASVTFEIIGGKRRNSKLLYIFSQEQLYIKKSESKGKKYYVCYVQDCKSRVILANDECVHSAGFADHNHGSQKELYEELKVLNGIKKECLDSGNLLGGVNALSGIRESFETASKR